MNCGVCNKVMRKDVKIDDIRTCYVCRKIWIDNFNKMKRYAIKHKDDLKY
jgi:hypothetical protein